MLLLLLRAHQCEARQSRMCVCTVGMDVGEGVLRVRVRVRGRHARPLCRVINRSLIRWRTYGSLFATQPE